MIQKIISGAQTGVDRAGLDFAIDHNIPHGGWVPKGRLSEDGIVPAKYTVQEHPVAQYPGRTEWNIRDSDATAIFNMGLLNDERGCLLTVRLCKEQNKPFVVLPLAMDEDVLSRDLSALLTDDIKILNVAGARGSRNPDVRKVKRVLEKAFKQIGWLK